MSEHLPRPAETFDQYLRRTMPGVWHAFNNNDTLTIGEQTCLLFGMQYAAFKRLWEDKATERSTGVAAKLIAAAELKAAEREIADAERDLGERDLGGTEGTPDDAA